MMKNLKFLPASLVERYTLSSEVIQNSYSKASVTDKTNKL